MKTILWLRRDLRLTDHEALSAASATGEVIPLYIHDENDPGVPGEAQKWWLHRSLQSLQAAYQAYGIRLLLRRGAVKDVLEQVIRETKAGALSWSRLYEPETVQRDTSLKAYFKSKGLNVQSFPGALLFDPYQIQNGQGAPYKVFSQFWKTCLKEIGRIGETLAQPSLKPSSDFWASETLASWHLLPQNPDWTRGFESLWAPGEVGAHEKFDSFIKGRLESYQIHRDYPGTDATSRLSPHLHFGEISPRQIINTVFSSVKPSAGAESFLSEIGWREFSAHLLFHFPHMSEAPFRTEFEPFVWQENPELLAAWQKGRTGYPIVDAGMRELWQTGWMHNRVRMIVASFLTKDLLLSWREGEAWFRKTLLDADAASNIANWQWVAGCGADAAPYFRIFNPLLQSRKFDPDGTYIRRWVPELAALTNTEIHEPWKLAEDRLQRAGLEPGKTYPRPIVDHAKARALALKTYEGLKKRN